MNFAIRDDETYTVRRAWGYGLEPSEWFHIAGVYDGEYVSSYINGEVQESYYTGPVILSQNTRGLSIGNRPDDFGRPCMGSVDDVRIYDRGFSADEIRQAYRQGLTKEQPIGYSGDYRLQPSSPCIDAGDNMAVPGDIADLDGDGNTVEPVPWDLDGRRRVVDGDCNCTPIVDMGAYEFGYLGDLDCTGSVNMVDFAIFALAWLSESGDGQWNACCDISIPADGYIDWQDLDIFVDDWLAGF
jgi:hypothetical protein